MNDKDSTSTPQPMLNIYLSQESGNISDPVKAYCNTKIRVHGYFNVAGFSQSSGNASDIPMLYIKRTQGGGYWGMGTAQGNKVTTYKAEKGTVRQFQSNNKALLGSYNSGDSKVFDNSLTSGFAVQNLGTSWSSTDFTVWLPNDYKSGDKISGKMKIKNQIAQELANVLKPNGSLNDSWIEWRGKSDPNSNDYDQVLIRWQGEEY